MARKYRVGIEFVPKDKLTKALQGYSRQFKTLHHQVEGIKGLFASFDREAVKGLHDQMSQFAGLKKALGGTVASRRQEIKLAALSAKEQQKVRLLEEKTQGLRMVNMAKLRAEQAKVDGIRKLNDEKHRQEVEKANQIQAKTAGIQRHSDDLHTQSLQRQEILENQIVTSAHRRAVAEDRVTRMKQRQRRELERETKDQQKLLDLTDKIMAKVPTRGNRIGGGLAIAGGAFEGLKGIYGTTHDDSYHHYLTAQNGLLQMNLSKGDQAQAQAAIRRLQGMSGMGLAESVETVKDLINVKGSIEEATKGDTLSKFAKFMVQNKIAYGMNEQQGYSAAKAAEMLMNQRTGRGFEQSLDVVQQVMAGTGGKVGGSDLLNFAKTAQSARSGLSTQGLMGLVPLIQEMGGSRAGTALMSVMQNLANGRASHASAQNLMDLGLVNRSMVELDKTGRMKRIKPGGIVGDDLLRADPLAWVEKFLMPKTNGMNQAQVDRMVNSILGQRTAAGLVTAMITQNSRIHKDMGIVSGAVGIDKGYGNQMGTLPGSEEALAKSWEKLRGKVADSVTPVLIPFFNSLSKLIDSATGFANKHPRVMGAGIGGATVGLGLAGAAGTAIAGKGVLDAFKGLRALGRFGGPVAAELGESIAAGAAEKAGTGLLSKLGGMLTQDLAGTGGSVVLRAGGSIGSAIARSSMGIAIAEMGTGLVAALPMILTDGAVLAAAAGVGYLIGTAIGNAAGKAVGDAHPEWFGGKSHGDIAKAHASMDYWGNFNAINRQRVDQHLPSLTIAQYDKQLHPLAAAVAARGRTSPPPSRAAATTSHSVTVPVTVQIQHTQDATAAATADAAGAKAQRIIRDTVHHELTRTKPTQLTPVQHR